MPSLKIGILDPRTRLAVVFALTSLAVFNESIYLAALLLVAVFLAVTLFGGDFSVMRRLLRFGWAFIILMFVQSVFTKDGVVLLQIGSIELLTSSGIQRVFGLLIRLTVIVLSSSVLLAVSPRQMVQALIQCRVPYEIAFMVQLAIRFLPMLQQELQDALVAIQLRGVELQRIPLRKRIRLYSYLFLPILADVINKAQEISTAMEMRGFRASNQRTSHLELRLRKMDYVVITGTGLFLASFLLLKARL